jgi:Leucine-rich repeat (LRR) protein
MVLLQCYLSFGSFWESNMNCSKPSTCNLQINESESQGGKIEDVHIAVETLVIVDSKIPRLPNNLLQLFPNIEILTVDKCGLESIQPELFGRSSKINSTQLINLELADNNIKTIENYSFEKCPNLLNINLANNSISSIGSEAFGGLKKLGYLELYNNKLQILDENVFVGCPMLEFLNLGRNQLTDTACINSLLNMTTLDLSYNENIKLTTSLGVKVNFGVTVTSLKLNGIKQSTEELFEFMSQFKGLISLSIENNEISELGFYNFPKLENLKNLNLYGNNLNDLSVDELRNKCPTLKTINIGNNPWECSKLELMIIKLRSFGIYPITHQQPDNKCEGQVDGFNCCIMEEIIHFRSIVSNYLSLKDFIPAIVLVVFLVFCGIVFFVIKMCLKFICSNNSSHDHIDSPDSDFYCNRSDFIDHQFSEISNNEEIRNKDEPQYMEMKPVAPKSINENISTET